jgi:hypothetical protein
MWRPSPTQAVMGAVALGAAGARLPGVYTQAFWEDEVASARIIAEPTFGHMLSRAALTESTPPLWYTLGWVAHELGAPMRDIRLLSVAAGVLLGVLVVELARRFVPLPLAAAAGALVAVGGELVAHGQELRAYELLALVSVLFARALCAELEAASRRREVALAVVVACGGLTHYFFAFSVLAALAWLWLDPAARAIRRRATVAISAGGVGAAAWGPVMLEQYHRHRFSWIGPFHLRYVVAAPLRLFTYAYSGTTLGLALSCATLALVVLGCSRLGTSPQGRLVAVLALGPLLLAGAAWAGGMRIFALRNVLEIAPFVAVASVAALNALRAPRLAAAGLLACLLLSVGTGDATGIPPYDAMARALVAEGWQPATPVAVFGDELRYRSPLEWYLPRQPALAASRSSAADCGTVLAIVPDRRLRALAPRADRVGSFVVERLRLDGRALRGATLLSGAGTRPACAHARRATS